MIRCLHVARFVGGVKRQLQTRMETQAVPTEWKLQGSKASHICVNPIRQTRENHYVDLIEKCEKDILDLAYGDPTKFGNLPPHPAVNEALKKALDSSNITGYSHSYGVECARRAIAEAYTTDKHPLTYNDVIMVVGTAGALELCFTALCDRGRQHILLPKPGFAEFGCFADAVGIETKRYSLLPERGWEVDLEDLEKQIDENTAAILVNNPSNPCGSVFSRQHITDILAVAERHKIPIIADEVYGGMVFKGKEFHLFGSLSKNVPVIGCGSLSKRYLVPGFRCGWVIMYDKHGLLKENIIPGFQQLVQRPSCNPAAIIQQALPDILKNVPKSFLDKSMEVFENNAKACFSALSEVPGLVPVMPAGAMYMMVKIELEHFPEFNDDVSFLKQLVLEQGVVCMPGSIFQYPSGMRIVLIMPQDKLTDALSRLAEFCRKYYV